MTAYKPQTISKDKTLESSVVSGGFEQLIEPLRCVGISPSPVALQ